MSDIDHPAHYGGDSDYEVIKVLRAWDLDLAKGFCWGNLIKYTARADKKGSSLKDREKAAWYANELVSIEAELEGAKGQPLDSPPLYSHWIWTPPSDYAGSRARVVVTGVAGGIVRMETAGIEGQKLNPFTVIRSTLTTEDFREQCRAIDTAMPSPWAESKTEPGFTVAGPSPMLHYAVHDHRPDDRCEPSCPAWVH